MTKTFEIEEMVQVLDRCRKYLWISIKHKNSIGINRPIFSIREIYRFFSGILSTSLYLDNKVKFDTIVKILELIIKYYGLIGRDLITTNTAEGYLEYIRFSSDFLGSKHFDYPAYDIQTTTEIEIERYNSVWNELQEISENLQYEKFKRLFLFCCKALHEGNYHIIYSLVKEMDTGHPRVSDLSKDELLNILKNSRLELFWIGSMSLSDTSISDIFDWSEHPASPITKCYLILRSYSIFKEVPLDSIMTFSIPQSNDRKVILHNKIDFFIRNKDFLSEAYKELLNEKLKWDELFKGKFIPILEETMKLINKRIAEFPPILAKIKLQLPLDVAKISSFKEQITKSFADYRAALNWVNFNFVEYPQDIEKRVDFDRKGLRSLLPRDMFLYGMFAINTIAAGQIAKNLIDSESEDILNSIKKVSTAYKLENNFSQKNLFNVICNNKFTGDELVVLLNISHLRNVIKWPIIQENAKAYRDEQKISVTLDEKDTTIKFVYLNILRKDEIFVLPLRIISIETERTPLLEINEQFKFNDYTGDTSDKVEFIIELITNPVISPDSKVLLILLKDIEEKNSDNNVS